MKHYIDITLLPSDDIGVHFLWSKVMMQVHLALVEVQDTNKQVPVAVSFPNYKIRSGEENAFLGNKLRLFANELSDFEHLNINKWFARLQDYVHIKAINAVPDSINVYESYNRITKAGTADKHIRRRMKRHNESEEQAAVFFEGYTMSKEVKALPFIKMKSLGKGMSFNMSIRKTKATRVNNSVRFNTYGFSNDSALPKF